MRLMDRWRRDVRDVVLFLMGTAGVVHETMLTELERPTLLLLFAAMLGLPTLLRADEKKRKAEEDE